jgi:hypothetical protein
MSNETCPPLNCTSWGGLQANSEIAGIGVSGPDPIPGPKLMLRQVIIGFMASAYLTLVMVIVYYFFDRNKTSSRVDRVVIEGFSNLWPISKCPKPPRKWSDAIETAVLMFSDQQLVTGIGILVSGYTQLSCSLSTYHWQIVVYLAWFSSLTHLTTLTALREFFRENPTLSYWRVVFMGLTMALLASALIPIGYVSNTSSTPETVPATCLFSSQTFNEAFNTEFFIDNGTVGLENYNLMFMLLTLLFLFVSYISRVIGLFSKSSNIALKALRIKPGCRWKKIIVSILQRANESESVIHRRFCYTLSLTMMTVYVMIKVMLEIGQSMFWEVCFQFSFPGRD